VQTATTRRVSTAISTSERDAQTRCWAFIECGDEHAFGREC
jgi:hypothetical protein